MQQLILAFLLLFLSCSAKQGNLASEGKSNSKPRISFTFDDGNTADMPGYPFKTWNALLLQNLARENIKAVFFVTGANKTGEKGRFLLESWNAQGHRIGNHTFTHPSYGSPSVTFDDFKAEFLKTDSLISQYSNYIKLFRFPYLKEGDTESKISQFRVFLHEQGYQNGHVTIDASDWYIDSRLVKRLKENPRADLEGFKQYYLEHLYDRAMYYENLAGELTGRHISHTLLLHHNLAAALFLDDLIAMFKAKGWEIINTEDAFTDPVFKAEPTNIPAGESLIWALAKQSGKYDGQLRYPAEDDVYEKDKMDKRGL